MVPNQGKREGGFMVNLVSMFFMSPNREVYCESRFSIFDEPRYGEGLCLW